MSQTLKNRLFAAISALPSADLSALLADARISKAEVEATDLLKPVDDMFTDDRSTVVPPRKEIKTGPGLEAAGGQPEGQIARYSDLTEQSGTTRETEKLGRMVEGMGKAFTKAINNIIEQVNANTVQMNQLVKAVSKAEESEKEEKAEDKIKEEVKKLDKSMSVKEEGEDEWDDVEKAIRSVNKSAQPLVTAAREHLNVAKSFDAEGMARRAETARDNAAMSLIKARRIVKASLALNDAHPDTLKISKSIDEMVEEADGKEETPTKENTADSAHETAKSANSQAAITAALEGIGILKTQMSDMMDVVAGKKSLNSLVKAELPAAVKGADTLAQRIMQAEEEGTLDAEQASVARDLLQMANVGVAKSLVPKEIFEQRLRLAPHAVRQIFGEAA